MTPRSFALARPRAAMVCGCGALLLAFASQAQDLQPIPPLEARVTDLSGTLTAEQQAALEEKLRAFEARKGSQVAVLIVPTTEPEAIEQYGIRVADAWRLGRKGVDDGALLLVAKDDRRMRIEVGYGLEGALPDAIAKRIVAETITPLFRQGDFFGGINAGIDQMIRVIDGEPLPEPDRAWKGGRQQDFFGLLPVLLIVVLVGSTVMRSVFGRPLGAALTGGGVGFLAYIVSQALGLALVAGAIAFMFSLFAGLGRSGWSSDARHGGWGGGWTAGGWGGGFRGGG
ncbi:MAG TPA: YgcG family protein, partial [Steroidobacteraceae bacterium]|nr:YgcG family protein [Steroidobacteraceae bacterium]